MALTHPRRRNDPGVLAAVAVGGALGAPARYGVAQLVHAGAGTFPWATFWTNVTGSFVLGVVVVVVARRFPSDRYLRPFVATGFLGAYTTYSTFAVEAVVLARDGQSPWPAPTSRPAWSRGWRPPRPASPSAAGRCRDR